MITPEELDRLETIVYSFDGGNWYYNANNITGNAKEAKYLVEAANAFPALVKELRYLQLLEKDLRKRLKEERAVRTYTTKEHAQTIIQLHRSLCRMEEIEDEYDKI